MSLATLQEELLPIIEEQLKAFYYSLAFEQSQELQEMIAYHMGWGEDSDSHGKRIRPLLLLLTTGACDGKIEDGIPAAIAIEYLHNFTLIHDDIEDDASIRHGRKTLWKKWGLAQGINAGDALFSIAQLAMLDLEQTCSQSTALQAVREFNRTCFHLTRGQYLDISFESSKIISLESYLAMIQGKTAALISLATRLGGSTAQQREPSIEKLGQFGEALGMAFQIQDDYLGVWGDPQTTGKSVASDLITNKKTLPVIFGLQNSEDFKNIWEIEGISNENLEKSVGLLISCGAQNYTKTQAEGFTNQAFSILGGLFPQRNPYSDGLFELTEMLLHRKY
jgi:geranylgeranyl diphosphate synthase type I